MEIRFENDGIIIWRFVNIYNYEAFLEICNLLEEMLCIYSKQFCNIFHWAKVSWSVINCFYWLKYYIGLMYDIESLYIKKSVPYVNCFTVVLMLNLERNRYFVLQTISFINETPITVLRLEVIICPWSILINIFRVVSLHLQGKELIANVFFEKEL